MAKSFNVPCPSCEADVLVKNDSLIGKKIDCTKCKYRFKVPDPNAGADEAVETAEVTTAKKKPNSKKMIGIGAGIAALALLAGVGYWILGVPFAVFLGCASAFVSAFEKRVRCPSETVLE